MLFSSRSLHSILIRHRDLMRLCNPSILRTPSLLVNIMQDKCIAIIILISIASPNLAVILIVAILRGSHLFHFVDATSGAGADFRGGLLVVWAAGGTSACHAVVEGSESRDGDADNC